MKDDDLQKAPVTGREASNVSNVSENVDYGGAGVDLGPIYADPVTLVLPRDLALKLHAAVLIRALRFHMGAPEQAELDRHLAEALWP